MKRTFLVIALGLACALTQAHAKKPKPIAPDTLSDLKAEMNYQHQQLMPFLEALNAEHAKLDKCEAAFFADPTHSSSCEWERRWVRETGIEGNPAAIKYLEAKEAYEREQRKVDRTK